MNEQLGKTRFALEHQLEAFDRSWHSGDVPAIEEFLTLQVPATDRQRLLVELVMIDQEYRWRQSSSDATETFVSEACGASSDSEFPDRPRLDDYVQQYPELGDLQQLPMRLLVNEFRVLQRWGDRPNPEVYVARYSLDAEHTQEVLSKIASQIPESGNLSACRVSCPYCHATINLADDDLSNVTCPCCFGSFNLVEKSVEPEWERNRRLGRFELLEQIGVGNFGTVWRARDEELKRDVAIKIPRRTKLTVEEVEQFLREAQTTAQLRHPNIVSVHEIGRQEDCIYIVSDFVHGLTLADRLEDQQLNIREVAELCAKVSDALHHAHEAGVVHRDLKPSNIMLDAENEPHIMDFGLARREAGEVTMTLDGKVLGTPAYMSPEQAKGEANQADSRSDIYSLGVILFELLTGEKPFRGHVRMLLNHVIHDEPPSPRKLNPTVPTDMETICLKCLEKDPQNRYHSADQVADELRRFWRAEPIRARPISSIERMWRWCKRKPMGALAASLLIVLAVGGPLFALRESVHRSREAKAREDARRRLYVADMIIAQEAWRSANLGRVFSLLRPYENSQTGQQDLRRFTWYYLWRLCQRGIEAPTLRGHSSYVWHVEFSPDGQTLATASTDGSLKLWDIQSRKPLYTLTDNGGALLAAAFSSDGRLVASAGRGEVVMLWDPATGLLKQELTGAGFVTGLAFSSSDKLAASSVDGMVTTWDLSTAQSQTVGRFEYPAWSVAWSRDGKRLAVGLADGTVRILDLNGNSDWLTLTGHNSWARHVAFSPDGKYLASASHDHTARLWNAATGEHLGTFPHHDRVWCVAFSPDSKTLASSGNSVKLWDVESRTEKDFLIGHEQMVYAIAFSPDGSLLATAGHDTIVKLWDLAASAVQDTLTNHNGAVWDVAVSPDDKILASASEDGTLRLWDLATGHQRQILTGHSNWVTAVAFSPNGRMLASSGDDGKILLWDTRTGKPLRTKIAGHTEPKPQPVFDLKFSPNSRLLASAGQDRTVRLWDVETGDQIARMSGHVETVWTVGFSPDGKQLASGGDDRTVKLWDLETGRELATLTGHNSVVNSVAFSRDGRFLASGSGDGTVKLWDLATRTKWKTLTGHTGIVWSVSFSPDNETLASSSHDATIKLWDFAAALEPETLTGHSSSVQAVIFSSDGNTLVSGSGDRTVRVWRRATESEVLAAGR